MAGIKIDITANTKDFAQQIKEFKNETRKLNEEQKRSNQNAKNLASSQLLLSQSTKKAELSARRLTLQENKLTLQEQKLEDQTKKNSKEFKNLEGSYNSLVQRNKQLLTAMKATENGINSNTSEMKEMRAEYTANNNKLKKFDKGLGNSQRNVGNYKDSLTGAKIGLAGFGGALASAKTNVVGFGVALASIATGVIAKGIFDIGTELEGVTIKFETLLGSSTKAKKRLEEIEAFSAKTPFQFPEVAKTSALLQSFGGDILATGKNLELVGDATAIAGVKIEELAVDFGRLFSALKSGGAVGEPLARFQELGLLSGELRKKIEDLNKAGKGTEAWMLIQSKLGDKVGGAMKRLSKTAGGLASTLKDQLFGTIRTALSKSGAWNLLVLGLENVSGGMDDVAKSTKEANGAWETAQETLAAFVIIGNGVFQTFKLIGVVIYELVHVFFKDLITVAMGAGETLIKLFELDFKGAVKTASDTITTLGNDTDEAFKNIANAGIDWFESLRDGENQYNRLLEVAKKANNEFEKTPVVPDEGGGGDGLDGEKEIGVFLIDNFSDIFEKIKAQNLELIKLEKDKDTQILNNQKETARKRFEAEKKFQEMTRRETLKTLQTTKNAMSAGFNVAQLFAGKNKALAISEALVNGALGITKTFATYGATPPGFIGAGLIASNTALQVQEISKQKFADGGLSGGRVNGSGTPRGDKIATNLSAGEFVVNQGVASQNMPMLKALNSGSTSNNFSFSPVVNITSSESTEGSITTILTKQRDEFVDFMKDLQDRGELV